MKINFKKVATVLGSALMLGSTAAMAAAASFTPSSFSDGGLALVVGQKASISDMKNAVDLGANLAPATSTVESTATVSGGDSVKIEGASSKFGLGDLANSVLVTSINSDKMPSLLVDGTYTDDDNTEYKFTQKIALGSAVKLNHFSDSDYADKTPTIGVNLSDTLVATYTLDFDTNPLFNASQMETTTVTMMGKEYYVLDVQNGTTDKLTLLDSANSAVITDGETSTITAGDKSYEVSISFIDSAKVKLIVNGQTTNSLATGATYKLSDGTYVGIKDILYSAKDTGVSKAEISIGKGKLEITSGSAIQLNDDSVNEIVGTITLDSLSQVDKITLAWTTDGEEFITPTSSLTMPGFESLKVSMADFFAPKQEVTSVKNSGSNVVELKAPIKSGDVTIPLLYSSSGIYAGIGKDASNKLVTSSGSAITFNQTAGDKYIVASWNSSTEAETYYLKVEVVSEDDVNKTKFTNVLDTTESKTITSGNDVSFGNVVITTSNVNYTGSTKWTTLTAGTGVNFNTLYTKEGMKVILPYTATITVNSTSIANGAVNFSIIGGTSSNTTGHDAGKVNLYFSEENKDSDLGANDFHLVLGNNSDGKVQVTSISGVDSGFEIGDTENNEYYVVSDLATKIVHNTGDEQDSATITYAGGQSYANAYVTAPSANVTAGSGPATNVGVMTVYDNEVSSVSSKNLIVIGGSCVNSVAAELLGGALCGDAFTAKTGIKSGEALIESFTRGTKTALLVSGYNAEDTTKAVTYLSNNNVNTAVGSKLKVTAANTATAITA